MSNLLRVISFVFGIFGQSGQYSPLKKYTLSVVDWIVSTFFALSLSLKVGFIQVLPDAFGLDRVEDDTAAALQIAAFSVVIIWGMVRGWHEAEKAMMKRHERKKKGSSKDDD